MGAGASYAAMDEARQTPMIETLGCRLNAWESEAMRGHARAAGIGRAVIINSCAVTGEAVRQTRQAVRRAARANPGAPVIVTGCAAQIDPQAFAAMPEVARVLGNDEKLTPETWTGLLDAETPRVRVGDIMQARQTRGEARGAEIHGTMSRARAHLQVQTGCDHRCTFCVIPYGRGNSRSVPLVDAVARARALADAGHAEIVLTGVDITSWGHDLDGAPKLGRLVAEILRAAPGLTRLRLSSLDAIEIDEELFDLIAHETRLAPHLHLSLQSGDDMILKRMKRRHSRADAVALTERLRAARPDIAFGADLIAGFPTETETMFANTEALIGDCGLSFVHVFPFSPREGTPAARMPQLDRAGVKARAARLRACADDALARHHARRDGSRASLLVERAGWGRDGDFTLARIPGGAQGQILSAILRPGADGAMNGLLAA